MAAFEAWLVFLILVVNVVGELQRKRTLAASRGFLAAARLSCCPTLSLVHCIPLLAFQHSTACIFRINSSAVFNVMLILVNYY